MAWTVVGLVAAAVAAYARGQGGWSPEAARDPAPAIATSLSGPARVVDGDTLVVDGRRIRLYGIDAPETHQDCTREGASYGCGQVAKAALDGFIHDRPVACAARDTDHYGRTVAQCRVGEEDLGAWMVANGWAVAYTQYSRQYVIAEDTARAAGRGVWSGEFEKPWLWRRDRKARRAEASHRNAEVGLIEGAPGSI